MIPGNMNDKCVQYPDIFNIFFFIFTMIPKNSDHAYLLNCINICRDKTLITQVILPNKGSRLQPVRFDDFLRRFDETQILTKISFKLDCNRSEIF